MIEVCLGLVVKDNKLLLIERKNRGDNGLLWAFPGGKVKPNETLQCCIYREIKEETGLLCNPRHEIGTNKIGDDKLLHYWTCDYVGGNLKPNENEIEQCRFYTYYEAQNLFTTPIHGSVKGYIEDILGL